MNSSTANAASGRSAGNAAPNINNPDEALTARGFFNPGQAGPSGRSFNAIPAQREASRSSSRGPSQGRSHGRGRNPQRTPQQPNLPRTYNGDGQAVPNSVAELAAWLNTSRIWPVSTRSRKFQGHEIIVAPNVATTAPVAMVIIITHFRSFRMSQPNIGSVLEAFKVRNSSA
jgi:hypothetical protein